MLEDRGLEGAECGVDGGGPASRAAAEAHEGRVAHRERGEHDARPRRQRDLRAHTAQPRLGVHSARLLSLFEAEQNTQCAGGGMWEGGGEKKRERRLWTKKHHTTTTQSLPHTLSASHSEMRCSEKKCEKCRKKWEHVITDKKHTQKKNTSTSSMTSQRMVAVVGREEEDEGRDNGRDSDEH